MVQAGGVFGEPVGNLRADGEISLVPGRRWAFPLLPSWGFARRSSRAAEVREQAAKLVRG